MPSTVTGFLPFPCSGLSPVRTWQNSSGAGPPGLYLSLGPSLAAQVTGSPDLLWGGLLVFLLTGVAAAATVAFRGLAPRTAMLAGCLVLLAGLGGDLRGDRRGRRGRLPGRHCGGRRGLRAGAARRQSRPDPLAAPGQRAGLIAAIFIINYLGLGIPVVIAGVATAHFGLHRTALAYCVAMAALIAAAAGSLMLRGRGQAKAAPATAEHG